MGAIYLLLGSLFLGLLLVLFNERHFQHSTSSSSADLSEDRGKELPIDFSFPKENEGKIRKKIRNEFSGEYQRMRKELANMRLLLFLIVMAIAVYLYFNMQS